MIPLHCHACGGFIGDPTFIAYRLPTPNGLAAPRSGLCTCGATDRPRAGHRRPGF